MTDNKIQYQNGKKIMMVDIGPAKNKKQSNTNNKKEPIKSSSRKTIKNPVNLLEDSDSSDNSDDSSQNKQNNDPNKLTRLSYQDEGYKRSQKKKQNQNEAVTTPEDIREKLKFYKKVDDTNIANIQLGMRIKYVEVFDDGTYKFKPGGELIVNKAPDYIVLAGNRKSWSVQLATHIIFVEQLDLVRRNYEQQITHLMTQNNKLKNSNNKYTEEINILKTIVKNSGKNVRIVNTAEKPKSAKVTKKYSK